MPRSRCVLMECLKPWPSLTACRHWPLPTSKLRFTTAGIGLALYMLPKLSGKALYSHRLGLWGLWSVWTGQHHQLYSPAPDWLEYLTIVFSILAVVPTTAFMVNFFMTMRSRWHRAAEDVALRFFVTGAIFWRSPRHSAWISPSLASARAARR